MLALGAGHLLQELEALLVLTLLVQGDRGADESSRRAFIFREEPGELGERLHRVRGPGQGEQGLGHAEPCLGLVFARAVLEHPAELRESRLVALE